ncbi:hypothetical protein J8J14_08455 [Roseomonas sp. SSH11]|uniref:Uncharacterized protein n=1 Tax=Pararoseomonas baculiformis TaxID=2820812 RepID=A0ABS4ACT0_9PROT|nr:hypothetical protein [Pararoseomonas baculiformis]MBP0444815.1 hypothetical protein [Pararoseomonas baculiformis]
MSEANRDDPGHDPGDSVPPGVAPKYPPDLSEEEKQVKRKLEQLGNGAPVTHDQPQGQAETDGPEKRGA